MISSNIKYADQPSPIGRRSFLTACGAATIGLTWWYFERRAPIHAEALSAGLPQMVTIVDFTDAGKRTGKASVARITKTEEEWRKQLSPDSFEVTRHAGTERAYTNENPNAHAKGVFRCICCDTALFNSNTKFDSGTGWPSFWEPIAKENVLETTDSSLGMVRTAVSCRLCDAHLGHVFDDGPRPTGLRYCMNSVAMKFAKAS
ncbi:MAG TPA: peptide-methionine (R)-S-oxide reductase MsrB [Candidatus Acidoferrum sp.]|jgi:peptide-methionine (R)-S-oxide reductase